MGFDKLQCAAACRQEGWGWRGVSYQQSIAKGLFDDAGDAADVFSCIQKQHQVHACLVLQVVLHKVPLNAAQQAGLVCHWLILLAVNPLHTPV